MIGFFLGGSKQRDFLPFWLFRQQQKNPQQFLSDEKKEVQQTLLNKIKKDLFEVSLRVYISQTNKNAVTTRMNGFVSSFQALHTDAQKLQAHGTLFFLKPFLFFTLK